MSNMQYALLLWSSKYIATLSYGACREKWNGVLERSPALLLEALEAWKKITFEWYVPEFLLSMKSKLLDNTHVPSLEILFKKTDIALCSFALIFQGILQYCIFV